MGNHMDKVMDGLYVGGYLGKKNGVWRYFCEDFVCLWQLPGSGDREGREGACALACTKPLRFARWSDSWRCLHVNC